MAKKFNPEIADKFRLLTGEFFRDRRMELGMTQKELCECSGLDQPNLSRFEKGIGNVTINTMVALAGCLRMEIQFHKKDPNTVPGIDPVSPN
jgi:transcriptional regulator with XRE-family HTH domain